MNPYDFVRLDWSRPPARRAYVPHSAFVGLTGHLEGTITTETPLFVPEPRAKSQAVSGAKQFLTNSRGHKVIPGSSLKGLARSLVETIAPGCWLLFGGAGSEYGKFRDHKDYLAMLPGEFRRCTSLGHLCLACQMFGLIQDSALLASHVSFEDAVCPQPVEHSPIYTPILDAPKPRHEAWYLSTDRVTGRKFYFHADGIRTVGDFRTSGQGQQLNQHIHPIGAGSVFALSAHFKNLDTDGIGLLLYALVLEQTMRHKIGYAKPAGLGSIRIELTDLTFVDYAARYTSPEGGKTSYKGDELRKYVATQVARFTTDRHSTTMNDLRRIWEWPPQHEIGYPGQQWFVDNPRKSIAET